MNIRKWLRHLPNGKVKAEIAENWRPRSHWFKLEPVKSERINRNAPCPCDSGRKYKQCCGRHCNG